MSRIEESFRLRRSIERGEPQPTAGYLEEGMSDTPRTDTKESETDSGGMERHAYYGWKFARTLERELSKRDAALARCVEALKAAEGAIMDEVCASSGEDHPVINAHAKIAEKARKVLASLPTSAQATAKVQQWQPIETAPRDSRYVLIANKNAFGEWKVREAWWRLPYEDAPMDKCSWVCHGAGTVLDASVHGIGATHWMPLPEPPEAIREEQEGK